MRILKNILIASFILSGAFMNASQKDVKVGKEAASEKAPFVPSDDLLKKAATATQQDKDDAAYSAAVEKKYDEVEFWFAQGANLERYFLYVLTDSDAKAIELALKYGVNWTKPHLIKPVLYRFDHGITDDIADLFLADSRFELSAEMLTIAVNHNNKNFAKRLFFLRVQSRVKKWKCPDCNDVDCENDVDYEYVEFRDDEIKEMFDKAKKGDFSFVSDDERKHFTAIAAKRMGMKSGNVFNHLRARELGFKQLPRLGHLVSKAKVAKKDNAKDETATAVNALEKLNLKDGSA